ncbi:MAG: ABC transporter ATP-binding protein [Cyanobium sp. Prado107]|jgi:iron(III) transport system ATP-binding protein|nr:ABC transporter ATP-binding protein [Cyanobium sp. Prado107]
MNASRPPATLLDVRGLCRRFGAGRAAVDDVSFSLEEGELLALLGPSGCGKTTTLRMIAGLERVDAGSVWLRGTPITGWRPERRGIGLVFQDYALFPHLTVAENVRFGLHRWPRQRAADRTEEMLELVGLHALARRYPHELSGGQQQRVALARTLAPGPDLVLLDEPFSNLDAAMRVEMRQEVRQLLHRAGAAAILVTHDQEEAMVMADRLALMEHGRLVQTGSPDVIYRQPASAFVACFLGRSNLLRGEAHGSAVDTALGCLPLASPAHGPTTIALRPEQIRLVADPEAAALVEVREFRGHDQMLRVRVEDTTLMVICPNRHCLREGERVRLEITEKVVPLPA